jgi:hypothetical protein
MAGYGRRARAIGSAGERLVHTEEVTGSIPVSPTQIGRLSEPFAAVDELARRVEVTGVARGFGDHVKEDRA